VKLNELTPAQGSRTPPKRVGRGGSSGYGKTCGRGHKGQCSRSGGGVRRGFEGGQLPLQQRIPTFGFRSRVQRITSEVRLHELNAVEGDVVDLQSLRQAGLITANIKRARIVLSGDVDRALSVRGVKVTKGAGKAIEAAGGKVEE